MGNSLQRVLVQWRAEVNFQKAHHWAHSRVTVPAFAGGISWGLSPFRSENSLGSQAHGGLLLGGVHPPRAGFGSVRDCGISDLGLP